MTIRLAASLFLAGSLACGGPKPAAEVPRPDAGAQDAQTVYFANIIGRFSLVDGQRYEDEALGVGLRYFGPDSSITDLFIYPGPDLTKDCALSCARDVMKQEVGAYRSGFKESIERGVYQSVDIVGEQPLSRGPADQWTLGHYVEARVVRNGKTMRSDFTLFYLRGIRLKVRQTYVSTPSLLAEMQAFVRQTVPAVLAAPRPLGEPTRENILGLIAGDWDWSGSNDICGAGRQRLSVAPDGKTFAIRYLTDTAATVYNIESVGPGALTDAPFTVRAQIVDEDRRSVGGRVVKWDLVLSDYQTYAWHRSDWEEDARTKPVFRCP